MTSAYVLLTYIVQSHFEAQGVVSCDDRIILVDNRGVPFARNRHVRLELNQTTARVLTNSAENRQSREFANHFLDVDTKFLNGAPARSRSMPVSERVIIPASN